MTTFMIMLLGGTNWLTMVFILVAKAGLIKEIKFNMQCYCRQYKKQGGDVK